MMNFHNITYKASYGTAAQLPASTAPEIVFSGRSNVGKSSLINKVFNRKNLARVSSVPGKTVTINFFECDGIHFVDLPGYGYAKKSASEIQRWSEMIEAYFQEERNIRMVFQLIDFRRTPGEEDMQMLRFLTRQNIPFTIVFTKCDKLNKSQTMERMERIAEELEEFDAQAVLFSALSGQGTEELKAIISDLAEEK